MIDIQSCSGCAHKNVCGKIYEHEELAEAVNKIAIPTGKQEFLYLKDSSFFTLDVRCKHFMKEQTTFTK